MHTAMFLWFCTHLLDGDPRVANLVDLAGVRGRVLGLVVLHDVRAHELDPELHAEVVDQESFVRLVHVSEPQRACEEIFDVDDRHVADRRRVALRDPRRRHRPDRRALHRGLDATLRVVGAVGSLQGLPELWDLQLLVGAVHHRSDPGVAKLRDDVGWVVPQDARLRRVRHDLEHDLL